MKAKHKFKLGDIVRHKSTNKLNARRMIIIGIGTMKDEVGTTLIYTVSGMKETYIPKDDSFFRVVLNENELDFYENEGN